MHTTFSVHLIIHHLTTSIMWTAQIMKLLIMQFFTSYIHFLPRNLTNLLYIIVHHCIRCVLVPMSSESFWLCYSGCGSHVLPVLGTLSHATTLLCLRETLTQLRQDKWMGLLYHRSVVTFITFSLPAPTISVLTSYIIYVYTEGMKRLNIPNLIIS